jgi:hypothetical protein
MANVKEVGRMFNALLSLETLRSPVKLDIRIPGHLTLVLAMAVEQGLSSSDPGNAFRKIVSEEDQAKLLEVVMEILKKAGLEEFYKQLKEISQG